MSVLAAAPAAPGLTSAEAAAILAEVGPNRVPQVRKIRLWQRIATQLVDPMIVLLLVAIALTVATGDHPDAIIIALVVVANTAVGVVQEVRADGAIAALEALGAPRAHVRRDGYVQEVPALSVVPGDVVLLGEGDVVPADGLLTEAAALQVDESSLTGESLPVTKSAPATDLAEASVSAGTTVVHGRGVFVITATGANSALGRLAALIDTRLTRTPLQRRLAKLSRTLTFAAAAVCLLVLSLGLLRGQSAELMVVTAISLAVAAIPESLPAVVTTALALAARRMSRRHAIVRRLAAVETLGSVTLLATDKTGTLTQGRMTVTDVWAAPEASRLHLAATPAASVLAACALCNDAETAGPSEAGIGDPTEVALLVAAAGAGQHRALLTRSHPRVAERPFDSDRRRMTTVHRTPHGHYLVVMKGAPRAVLSTDVLTTPGPVIDEARRRAEQLATAGARVLVVATREQSDVPSPDLLERGMELVGMVALSDPERTEAADAVAACRAAGIEPVLVTGDHAGTARAIAHRVGIETVFARTTPEQKLGLITSWRQKGHVVAMTGDGVNDAAALRAADIGVAMGRRGTEVARQAADIVLTDDNLATIVGAIAEGRRVYANVRRFLLYGMAGGAAELAVMLLGPAFGLALPLLPAQILWVNLLTHGLPGVALAAEPGDDDSLHRAPRSPREGILAGGVLPGILVLGALMAAATLTAALLTRRADGPWRSMAFLVLATAQLGVALGVRARSRTRTSRTLLGAVAAAALLAVAGAYVPPLQSLLTTDFVAPVLLLPVAAIAVGAYAAARWLAAERARP